MLRICIVWLLLPLVANAQPAQPTSRGEPLAEMPLAVRVAALSEGAAVDATFIRKQIEHANQIFEQHGVRVRLIESKDLPQKFAALESRADRDRLAAHLHRSAVTCFVVSSLRDVDDPSAYRLGVHWHKRRDPAGRHYVVLTAGALPSTMAHELVHFFGEPAHRKESCNLMSYDRDGCKEWLDETQGQRLRRAVERFVARKLPRPI